MSHIATPLAAPLGGDVPPDLTPRERDAFELILSLYPPGAREDLYAVDVPAPAQSDVGRYFECVAQALERYAAGPARALRSELDPSRATERLPDWEAALALPATRVAPTATADRQAAVVAKLRESGSYTLPNVRSIAGPLLGYADPTQLAVVETNRAALRAAHTYTDPAAISISGVGSVTRQVFVNDDAVVSTAGPVVRLANFAATNFANPYVSVQLTGPSGGSVTWRSPAIYNPAGTGDLVLRSTKPTGEHVGLAVRGWWTLVVDNTLAGNSVTADSWSLFVEGAQLDLSDRNGLGAAVYYFAPFADPLLEGAAGVSDRAAARAALRRIRPAHTVASVITTRNPKPGALVPSEWIPNS